MKKTLLVLIVGCFSGYVSAQSHTDSGLQAVVSELNSARAKLPIEKQYVQTDKPNYVLGDTLYFKSYLLNADFLTLSKRSFMLYVELDNEAGLMVKRIMVPVISGGGRGDIVLDEKEIPEGSYTLRAYTNWMLNFGKDYIFQKNIYISLANRGTTLVNSAFKIDSTTGKDQVMASLHFTNLDKDALRLKDMQLKVITGTHTLLKNKAATDMNGDIALNFYLTDKAVMKGVTVLVQQTGKGADTATMTIPIILNRPENTDLQFMPEGGNLVAGITTKVGFKAIAEDGKGTDITGKIVNGKNQEIKKIRSLHKGMGSFDLAPQAGESYTAIIDLPNKAIKTYPLPPISPTGTTLRVTQKGNDSITLNLSITKTSLTSTIYYLIGQSRGVICYTASIIFEEGTITQKKTIAKDLFPTGIVRFTLLSQNNQPLNERICYINHNDDLNISINTNKPNYTVRDSIALTIQIKNKDGKPIQGNFSLAVTDDSQIRQDSLGGNILNNLLFTSDLKGTVEDPDWYFTDDNAAISPTIPTVITKAEALDNLLLTQGWIGYDWKEIFNPKTPRAEYPSEKEFDIQGKVTNLFNKPVEKSEVLLFGKTPSVFRDILTDKNGLFIFKNLFPIDTAEFKIQARNKNGKSFNVGITMLNEFKPPLFPESNSIVPWYVNSDTTLLNNTNNKIAQAKAEANYRGDGHLLKEVIINEKKVVKGSHNLNGPGEADQVLNEDDLLKAGKMTLGELLEKKVRGFHVKGLWKPSYLYQNIYGSYILNEKLIHFFIDGVDVNKIYPDPNEPDPDFGCLAEPGRYTTLKSYMDFYTAEDITGIEVMYNLQYSTNYVNHIFSRPKSAMEAMNTVSIIEITTRRGHGAYLHYTPGTYLYRPLPFTLPKQFYRPRYTVKNMNSALGTDLRSTIHWEPDLIMDTIGKRTVSFFSADKLGSYTVIIQGTDLKGNLGYKRQKIKIGKR